MSTYYSPEDGMHYGFSRTGGIYITSDNEQEYLEKEKKELDKVSFTAEYLASTFPEARATIKKSISEKKKKINKLSSMRYEMSKLIMSRVSSYQAQEFVLDIASHLYITIPVQELQREVDHLERLLFLIKVNAGKVKIPEGYVDGHRAKQVPISNFIEFKRGVAKSLWQPNERTPSMHYYEEENRVWCFATNQGGDVIDVIQYKYNLSFKDAVIFILGHVH